MNEYLIEFFQKNFSYEVSDFVLNIIIFVIMIGSAFAVYYIVKYVLTKVIKKVVSRTKTNIDNIFFQEGVFRWLAHISPALVILAFSNYYTDYAFIFQKIAFIYITYSIIMSIILF